jgi:hypothetical protein
MKDEKGKELGIRYLELGDEEPTIGLISFCYNYSIQRLEGLCQFLISKPLCCHYWTL